MTIVNTVLDPMDAADLGPTLTHEHLFVGPPGSYRDFPELLIPNIFEFVVDGLKKAKVGGFDTIVDATTTDLGRDVELLAEASRRSGVNIIACTGWWLDFPRFFEGISPDQLAEVFIRETEQGISGTNIKAGILKSASDMEGLTPQAETVLRAIARAHHQTQVPIMLHSYSLGQVARQQLDILKGEGVPMNRIKIDHTLSNTDVEYLTWLLDQGCYLGMDSFPGRGTSPRARAKTMKALMDAGYADRLCPSHDLVQARIMVLHPEISEDERLRLNPHGYLYIQKEVYPMLKEMGAREEELKNLCIIGPRNFFEGI
jgi:phosphotriesterase-related protein